LPLDSLCGPSIRQSPAHLKLRPVCTRARRRRDSANDEPIRLRLVDGPVGIAAESKPLRCGSLSIMILTSSIGSSAEPALQCGHMQSCVYDTKCCV
jgi:hypothetical protein